MRGGLPACGQKVRKKYMFGFLRLFAARRLGLRRRFTFRIRHSAYTRRGFSLFSASRRKAGMSEVALRAVKRKRRDRNAEEKRIARTAQGKRDRGAGKKNKSVMRTADMGAASADEAAGRKRKRKRKGIIRDNAEICGTRRKRIKNRKNARKCVFIYIYKDSAEGGETQVCEEKRHRRRV